MLTDGRDEHETPQQLEEYAKKKERFTFLTQQREDLNKAKAQLLEATEKLQSALLHSISHDLRTPLATITVALSNLETAGDRLDDATRQALARTGRPPDALGFPELVAAVAFANRVAGRVCTRVGAVAGLPRADEISV